MFASKVTGEVRMKRHSERLLIFNSRRKKESNKKSWKKKTKTHAAFEA